MGVIDDLAQARTDYERGEWSAALDIWSDVDPAGMRPEDLHDAGVAAYLLGRRDTSVDYEQRAFAACQEAGDVTGAIRCCFHLAMVFGTSDEAALAQGWTARADRLLEDLPDDAAERGYVSVLHMHGHLATGDLPAASAAAAHATAAGEGDTLTRTCWPWACARRAGSRSTLVGSQTDCVSWTRRWRAWRRARSPRSSSATSTARPSRAARRSATTAGSVSGHRRCIAGAWPSPGLVAFTGQCSVHRGQLMRVHGAWPEALEEFELAIERYRLADSVAAVGLAECERGDVLRQRGEFVAAETAYQRSSEHGYDPQPGLALLWLARGDGDAAVAAVRRLVAEVSDPVAQCRLLPAAVDVLVAVGALDEARAVAARLDEVAAQVGTETLQAYAAFAAGTVELASGDAAGALPYLRKARLLWAHAQWPLRRRAGPPPDCSHPGRARRRGVRSAGARGRARHLPQPGRGTGRPGGRAPAAAGRPPRRADGPGGRGAATRRVRQQQPPDRGRAGAEREDGRSPPLEHLRQAGRRLSHRSGGVRLRAPAASRRLT